MRFLLLNQTFHPDVMATGQYLAEVAQRLVERGHEVTVVTSRRGYDFSGGKFLKEEIWRGVRIIRINGTGFGKETRWRRALDFGSFMLGCAVRVAFLPRADAVVALTSPPLISFLGGWLARLRGSRFYYWVMDLNPDEAMAAGWLRTEGMAGKLLEGMSRFGMREAAKVIVLDHFMRERILGKGIAPEKVVVLPVWSHEGEMEFDGAGRERFRRAHGLAGKFVVMYSGNHSPCHPLGSLMAAAERLKENGAIAFCFIGGGSEFKRVQQWAEQGRYRNARCLPYRPMGELAGALSGADLHVVVMGDAFVGLVHPCKIYNILSVGCPVLYIGPEQSHVSEIMEEIKGKLACYRAKHGEVDKIVEQIERARVECENGHRRAPRREQMTYSKGVVLPKLIELLCAGSRPTLDDP